MKITGATVLLSPGTDKVSLQTDLPSSYVEEFSPEQEPLQLSFVASRGTGVQYVLDNFGIEPEIINMRP